jgi:16S rRNA (uracil1498-N3)-methyltransferase
MTFLFEEAAGSDELVLKGEAFKYLVKVRRHAAGDRIAFRRPDAAETLFTYELVAIDGRTLRLRLLEARELEISHEHPLHVGWCVVDTKSVEKALPFLNELGVAQITFISCERSQKNFRPDFDRFERILRSSMQQCGRSVMMRLATMGSIAEFVKAYPDTIAFDFCDRRFDARQQKPATVLIGPEGGLCDEERALLDPSRVYRLATPTVLRSETAVVAVSSAVLL